MEKKISLKRNDRVLSVFKALLCAYVTTGICLLILACLLYRFHLKENQVQIGITAVYIISTFLGGFLCGKMVKVRKYLWGLILGVLYYVLLLLVSFGVYKTVGQNGSTLITTFFLCAGGGMAGGMIS